MTQSIICIAGAHRSGTSMLTRLLHEVGLALGAEKDLMPPAADNPDGFWENLRFVQLNDELLNAAGAAWDLPPWEDESFQDQRFAPMKAKARMLIETFSDKPIWGWKDPRSCLTLSFWQAVISDLKTVIIVRNPLEAAYSMRRRNGTSYALGLRLWEIYNRRLLAHTRVENRIVTTYGAFFERPEKELERLASFTGLPPQEMAATAAIVTRGRRHTSFTNEQLIDAGVSEQIIAIYDSLVAEANGSQSGAVDSDAAAPHSSQKRDHLAGAANELKIAVPESETVRRELSWRRGKEIEYQEKTRQLQTRIEKLTQEVSAQNTRSALEIGRRDGRITELQAAYAHLDELLLREHSGRDRLLSELERQRKELAEQSVHAAAEVERLRRELAEQSKCASAETTQLRQELDRNTIEFNQLRERFLQTNRLLHNYSVQLSDRESECVSLTARLRKQLGETKRLVRLLTDTERAADHLRNSRRWILANPFAWLASLFSKRQLRGFGHLDKIVRKFRDWQSAHPNAAELDRAIAGLGPRQVHLPPTPEPGQVETPAQEGAFTPAIPEIPIAFQAYEDVEVSIIIPVFNQIDFTQACLASVQKHADDIPFEVIVVDDCSTDATEETLRNIPGLIYCRKETNSGFTSSCNLGAERAGGRYLLFLNNDTVVTPGWLAQLRETFDFEPKAGLVGSKLVYPDGRLQEAGGIIWRDATGWNRGKFEDPAKPEYNFLRAVDYCSAASVLIPKSLFESLGGFDLKYAPAYYEDTDLAFKVRAAGREVLYQPLSVVIHYEGTTAGTDISAGVKRHQELNRATFAAAWEHVLANKPINGDLQAWDALQPEEKRILVIDHHLPMPERDAGSLRMFYILEILRGLGHRVTFIPDNLADIPPYGDNLKKLGIEVVHHPYIKSVQAYLQSNGSKFDAVILSRRDFASKHIENVRLHAPQARLIFDTVDLHFLREEREASLRQDSGLTQAAAETRPLEYKLIDEADETWVVSAYEQKLLQGERPNKSIEVVSTIVEVPGSSTPFSLRHDFLFIGGFQHTPNIDAVTFFVGEIYPLLQKRLPTARFYVIGDKAPPSVVALASETIIITGLQPDVQPYFESVKLSIAPLRWGAGVKGKINQSMGFGVPVVATRIAVEGMDLTDREDVLVADAPQDFANAMIELYESEDLWCRLSQNGIETTNARFSKKTAREKLKHLFGDDWNRTSPSLPTERSHADRRITGHILTKDVR